MPKKVCDFLNASAFKVYLSGQNLFTINGMKTNDTPVEGSVLNFPVYRMYRLWNQPYILMEMVHILNLNVMKKFRIIILAMVAAAALSSCQDGLDLRSNGTIDMSEVFQDRNRTKGYLNACYSYLKAPYVHAGAYTDDAQNSESITAGHRFDIWYNSDVTSSNFAANNLDGNPWGQFFQGVRKCMSSSPTSTAPRLKLQTRRGPAGRLRLLPSGLGTIFSS